MKPLTQSGHLEVDRQIESALQILRDAHPESTNLGAPDASFDAMNQRLLRNLRTGEAHNVVVSRRWFQSPAKALAASALVGAGVVALLVGTLSMHDSTSTQPSARNPSPLNSPFAQLAPAHRNRGGSFAAPTQRPVVSPAAPFPLVISATAKSIAPNALTVDPAFLSSFPAPVAPLTREEWLLVRMAEHGKPTMLARLETREQSLSGLLPQPRSEPLFAGFLPEPVSSAPASEVDPDTSSPIQPLSTTGMESSPVPVSPERPSSALLNESPTEPRP